MPQQRQPPSFLVVIPVFARDAELAIKNLELCKRFDTTLPYEVLLHVPEGFDCDAIAAEAATIFRHVHFNRYHEWRGEKAWPYGANWAWQEAARCIASRFKCPWFWWEQDAVPLRPGWLDALVQAWREGGKPFAGHIVTKEQTVYMNGVGFYPPNLSAYAPTAMRTQRSPFDMVAGAYDNIVSAATPLNTLIGLDPKHNNVTFYDKSELEALLAAGNVLFHHNKDGSLYQLLTGRPGPQRPLAGDVPSFMEQTPWPCGLFAFPPAANEVHFNPSLLRRDDTLYLFARRFRFPHGAGQSPAYNDLSIWRLSRYLTPIEQTVPATPARYELEQWEDPRVIDHGGTVYIGFATWVHKRGWNIRQSLTRLTGDWRRIQVLHEPKYGGNAPRPELATRHEKNWLWFMHNDAWHCVYLTNPMTVFRLHANGNIAKVWKNKPLALPWPYGEPRGGTTPIRVGSEYLTFFHSSQPWQNGQRRYFMGAVTFAAEPPFALRRITVEPLLIGSDRDSRYWGGPLVIFPCGAVALERDWLVSFGVNDEACGWLRAPQGEIHKMLKPIEQKPTLIERAKEVLGV